MRHIIVEGPDGSGKTNMVNQLMAEFNMPVFPRAATSEGGPIDLANLDEWVVNSITYPVLNNRPTSIFDRHPIISEPIYGPICRGGVPGRFNDPNWVWRWRGVVAAVSVVVWCLPPWTNVAINTSHGMHMVGVSENAYEIYQAYNRAAKEWPGPQVIHDYTTGPIPRPFTVANIRTLMNKPVTLEIR